MAVGMGLQNAAIFKLVPHYVPKAVGGAAGWARGTGSLRDFRDAWQPCRLESKAFVIYPSRNMARRSRIALPGVFVGEDCTLNRQSSFLTMF